MDYKHTDDTIYTHFQSITNNIYGLLIHLFTRPPVHPYFYPSIFVFTCPNDRWTGLCIKLYNYRGWFSTVHCPIELQEKIHIYTTHRDIHIHTTTHRDIHIHTTTHSGSRSTGPCRCPFCSCFDFFTNCG